MRSRAEVPEPEFEVEHEVPADGTAGCAQPLIASAASAAVARAGLADGSPFNCHQFGIDVCVGGPACGSRQFGRLPARHEDRGRR